LSINGEGVEIGLLTVFVCLFAFDLRYTRCDSMYAVEGKDFREMTLEEVRSEIEKLKCKRVCFSGGKPLIQRRELETLAKDLGDGGYEMVLETSGHKELPPVFWTDNSLISMDCKCPSSGMEKGMNFELFEKLRLKDQIKFVIKDEVDYNYAKEVLKHHPIRANIIFQPVYGTSLDWVVERVLEEKLGNVRVLPQLHKIIWGERRGV
jgi:7-carboxy-7-deazaguanine synthase